MEKIEIKTETLYIVNFRNKWYNFSKIATQYTIDFNKKWNNLEATVLEKIELPDYSNLELTLDNRTVSRCNVCEYYTLKSDRELTEYDFIHLRALNLFLNGQETGKVFSRSKENDKFVYKLKSERDSSD